MIEAHGLTKRYGAKKAADGLRTRERLDGARVQS